MDNPLPSAPPGQLRLVSDLDGEHIQVDGPAYKRVRSVGWMILLFILPILSMMMMLRSGLSSLGMVVLLNAIGLGLAWVCDRAFVTYMRKLLQPSSLMLLMGVDGLLLALAGGLTPMSVLLAVLISVTVNGGLAFVARSEPAGKLNLTLTMQALTSWRHTDRHLVRWALGRPERQPTSPREVVPLEEIASVHSAHGAVWIRCRDKRRIQIAEGLRASEVHWLCAQLTQRRDQRRQQLEAAGHDLSQPPADLAALRQAQAQSLPER